MLSFGIHRLEQTGKTHNINGKKVKSRKNTNNKWFETQDQISYWNDFFRPKIVWGEISDKTKFALNEKGEYFAEATTFLMTGNDLPYLVCYLNSTLSEYLFSKLGTTTGVGTVRWKKFKIEQLFIPNIPPEKKKIFEDMFVQLQKGKLSETKINKYIYDMCSLSIDEIAFIEKYADTI